MKKKLLITLGIIVIIFIILTVVQIIDQKNNNEDYRKSINFINELTLIHPVMHGCISPISYINDKFEDNDLEDIITDTKYLNKLIEFCDITQIKLNNLNIPTLKLKYKNKQLISLKNDYLNSISKAKQIPEDLLQCNGKYDNLCKQNLHKNLYAFFNSTLDSNILKYNVQFKFSIKDILLFLPNILYLNLQKAFYFVLINI